LRMFMLLGAAHYDVLFYRNVGWRTCSPPNR
jgi:hypothetical protein